jgi:hypothetical protein
MTHWIALALPAPLAHFYSQATPRRLLQQADSCAAATHLHSITLSARPSRNEGTSRLIAFAVLVGGLKPWHPPAVLFIEKKF